MLYRERIADRILNYNLSNSGAVLIDGPRACGKTTTAKQKAKSVIEFQNPDERPRLLATAENRPSRLLIGDKPRLIDEWQDAPQIWSAVRKSVDDEQGVGLYILTGESSRFVETPHSGISRIATMTMLPMSLYESGESNGKVSLTGLFDNPENFEDCMSDMSDDDIIYAICCGGWPQSKYGLVDNPLSATRRIFDETCDTDITGIEKSKKRPEWTRAILKSYARNICTTVGKETIYRDVMSTSSLSERTIISYVEALKKLYVIEEIPAWGPVLRSRTTTKFSPKHNFIDPSLAVAALGVGPEYFNTDYLTLGFLFESLCIRDLKVYSAPKGGRVFHFNDRNRLKADCVLTLADGRYALMAFRYGFAQIDEGAGQLCKIEDLIGERNKKEPAHPLKMPSFKAVITATSDGYRRDDGVFVIPIGCIKD